MSTSLDPDVSDAGGWHRRADQRLAKMTEYQRRVNAATRVAQDWRAKTFSDDPKRKVADQILAALHPIAAPLLTDKPQTCSCGHYAHDGQLCLDANPVRPGDCDCPGPVSTNPGETQ